MEDSQVKAVRGSPSRGNPHRMSSASRHAAKRAGRVIIGRLHQEHNSSFDNRSSITMTIEKRQPGKIRRNSQRLEAASLLNSQAM
jgi:hypothetical protein